MFFYRLDLVFTKYTTVLYAESKTVSVSQPY